MVEVLIVVEDVDVVIVMDGDGGLQEAGSIVDNGNIFEDHVGMVCIFKGCDEVFGDATSDGALRVIGDEPEDVVNIAFGADDEGVGREVGTQFLRVVNGVVELVFVVHTGADCVGRGAW